MTKENLWQSDFVQNRPNAEEETCRRVKSQVASWTWKLLARFDSKHWWGRFSFSATARGY
jgi:hypothetical protein